MKRWGMCVLLLGALCVKADTLDRISWAVDRMETHYFLAMRDAAGEYRRQIQKELNDLVSMARDVQIRLQKERVVKRYGLYDNASQLQIEFGKLRPDTVRRFKFSGFKSTAMKAYRGEFNRLEREKAAEASEESEAPKKKSRKRGRSVQKTPTLATVDPIEYERWLAEIMGKNMEIFERRRNTGNKAEQRKVQSFVNNYFNFIQRIRLSLVKIRQETKLKF